MIQITDTEFEQILLEAISNIPKEFLKRLENVTILYEDFPTQSQQLKVSGGRHPGLLLGLYEGVPQTRRGSYGIGGQLPDRITLFKKNIEYITTDKDQLKEIIKDTIVHEIAHHFGMDESMVQSAFKKR
jgi:predicted Zn-dependent protease with MMP-like domain